MTHHPSRRRLRIALGLLGAAGLAFAITLAAQSDSPAPPATGSQAARHELPSPNPVSAPAIVTPAPSPRAPAASAPTAMPTVEDILLAQSDPAPEAVDVLLAGLASEDAVVAAESANGLVARGATSALPTLVELDVIGRPWAAPSIIDAMGRLGAHADDDERGEVVARLVALMNEEKRRGARESQGNLLQIYEALGHTGDARAIAPLERELLDPAVMTAPKVVVVQALVALGATDSRGALEQVAETLAGTTDGMDFEAELRRDLLAVIQHALVQLS